MRIAFLHMSMGLVDRGSEVVVDQIASALAKKHDIILFHSGKLTSKPYRTKRILPLESAPSPAPKNVVDKILFRLQLDVSSRTVRTFTRAAIAPLRRFNPDIVVAINGAPQVRILQGQALKTRIVAFGHAGPGYHDESTLRAHPDLFIALTPFAKDWAAQINPMVKTLYIPNPLPSKSAKKLDLDLPHPVVLTVGALSRYKNILPVIQAVKVLQASLLLIGDGEQFREVAAELNSFPGDFRWLRHVDPAMMSAYYASADIFCFTPDPQEAFGRVYLEAMSAGLPIVASDDPIRRDIIGPEGIFVDPHDVAAIREGIQAAHLKGRIDYSAMLQPYQLKTVIRQIEGAFHAVIQ